MPLPSPAAVPVSGGRLIARQGPPHGTRSAYHRGVDITEPEEARGRFITPALVVAAGDVVDVSPNGSNYQYGNRVVVAHGPGLFSLYAHLDSFAVELGDHLEAGQQLGIVGNTFGTPDNPDQVMTRGGPHLHLELLTRWPRPTLADRLDVLHELAAVGVVLDRDLFVLGDPTDYSEPLLAGIKGQPGEGWREVVAPLESASPRVPLGPALLLGGLLAGTVASILVAIWQRRAKRPGSFGGTGRRYTCYIPGVGWRRCTARTGPRGPRRTYAVRVFDPSTGKTEMWSEGASRRAAEELEARLDRELLWDERRQTWYRLQAEVVEE